MKKKILFIAVFMMTGWQLSLANPLMPADIVGARAFPPEILISVNVDSVVMSNDTVYTSQGFAIIDTGVVAYYPEEMGELFALDSSNTSGFIINHEADLITVSTLFEDFPLFDWISFGNWGRGAPPIKGHYIEYDGYNPFHDPYNWFDLLSFDFCQPDNGWTDILINEISSHCDWGISTNFIEVFNIGNEPISLEGWRLVCDTIYDFPSDASIEPNSFYIVDETDFPSIFDMDYGADNIYLISNDDYRVDQVGWSSDHGESISFMRYPDGDVNYGNWGDWDDYLGYSDATSYTFENGFPTRGAPNRHESPGFVVIGAKADSVDYAAALIRWTDPIWDESFTASMLVKSHDGYVSSPEEGEIVYTGNNQEFIEEFIIPDMPYYFTVFARDAGGLYSTPTEESQAFIQFSAVGIDKENLPEHIGVLKCYPNPFNATTTISFSLEYQSPVNISIYDITGRLVGVLTSNAYEAGNHSLSWDAGDQPSGIYFARLTAEESVRTSRMVLLK